MPDTTRREVRNTEPKKYDDVIYQSGDFVMLAHDSTCWDCEGHDKCEYSFDPYNMHGDCLKLK